MTKLTTNGTTTTQSTNSGYYITTDSIDTSSWYPEGYKNWYGTPTVKPKVTVTSEELDVGFSLMDGTITSLPLKDYIGIVLIHHKRPEDCKDLEELGKLVKDSKMVEEL